MFFFIGCGSSQKSVTDDDPGNDGDTDDTDISDEYEPDGGQETNIPDKDKPNGETETDEPDDDENDTDTVKKDYCTRNICEKIENSAGKCISGEKDYSCECREND